MGRLTLALYVMTGVGTAIAAPRRGITIYVSSAGSDDASGLTRERHERDGPLATLEAARNWIREKRKRTSDIPIRVCVEPGRYERHATFELTAADGGTVAAPATYAACDGLVSLVGGHELHDFRPVSEPSLLATMTVDARAHVVSTDLRASGITDFGSFYPAGGAQKIRSSRAELFFDDQRMPIAHWPNEGWARITKVPAGAAGGRFLFDDERLSRWIGARDAWVYGFWTWDWADSYAKVLAIDPVRREIAVPPSQIAYGLQPDRRFEILNLVSELDEPGEWYLDRESGRLFFWPPGPLPPARIVFSMLSSPLVRLNGASNVVLDGFTFEGSRGAGVEIVGGAHNRILHGVFRNLGTYAVGIGERSEEHASGLYQDTLWNRNGGSDNGVDGCTIHDTGEGGVILGGGDRKTLVAAGNFVTNCDISRYSQWVSTLRPAIEVDGVGNRVAHNRIYDGPQMAIWLRGNDHLVEANEIHHVCRQTADSGAIYGGRDFSERGWIIRANYIHDLAPVAGSNGYRHVVGVYLDDGLGGETISGNLFADADKCILIHGGGDNRVTDNTFIRCSPAVTVSRADLTNDATVLMKRLTAIAAERPPYATRYPDSARHAYPNGAYRDNVITRNAATAGSWLVSDANEAVQLSSNVADAELEQVDGAFRFKPGSTAARLGLKVLAVDAVGPSTKERPRPPPF